MASLCGTCWTWCCQHCNCDCNPLPSKEALLSEAGRVLLERAVPWCTADPLLIEDQHGAFMYSFGPTERILTTNPGFQDATEKSLRSERAAYLAAQNGVWRNEGRPAETRVGDYAVRIFGFDMGVEKFTAAFFSPIPHTA